jgi:hypothetical protein
VRAFAAIALAICGCYRPSVPADVPCGTGDSCPVGQSCDHAMSPPTCVPGDGGAAFGSDAAFADAPVDSVAINAPDAFVPDAYVVPIAFVQEAHTKPTTAPTTLALPMDVTETDAIILCFNFPASAGAVVSSVTDSLGNTFHMPVNNVAGNGEQHYIFYADNSPGGADTITLTLSATVSGADFFALEYSGIAEHLAFDVSSSKSDTTMLMSSGTAMTMNAHDLILGFAEAPNGMAGTGFTTRGSQSGNLVEDKTVFTIDAYAATGSTTAGGWTMIMAAFKGQ